MSTVEPVSEKLRELLSAIPSHDRGLSWELRDYKDRERLEVYGTIAKAFKYILDNTDAVIAALSHVQAPAEPCGKFWYAVHSVTGVHIGLWDNAHWANAVLAEYPDGTVTVLREYSPAPQIDDAAVERALDEAGSAWGMHLSKENKRYLMRAALEAAIGGNKP